MPSRTCHFNRVARAMSFAACGKGAGAMPDGRKRCTGPRRRPLPDARRFAFCALRTQTSRRKKTGLPAGCGATSADVRIAVERSDDATSITNNKQSKPAVCVTSAGWRKISRVEKRSA